MTKAITPQATTDIQEQQKNNLKYFLFALTAIVGIGATIGGIYFLSTAQTLSTLEFTFYIILSTTPSLIFAGWVLLRKFFPKTQSIQTTATPLNSQTTQNQSVIMPNVTNPASHSGGAQTILSPSSQYHTSSRALSNTSTSLSTPPAKQSYKPDISSPSASISPAKQAYNPDISSPPVLSSNPSSTRETELLKICARISTLIPADAFSYQSPPIRGDQNPKLKTLLKEYHHSFVKVDDHIRFSVRDNTCQQICKILQLPSTFNLESIHIVQNVPADLQNHCANTHLFTDGDFTPTDGTELLGKFDVLSIPAFMAYDDTWNPISPTQPFTIIHAAAPNIGESAKADDFPHYRMANGSLNVKQYIDDMARIFNNMLHAAETSKITDVMAFPFGMGAFLRHLPKNDPAYSNPQLLFQLREQIAAALFSASLAHPNITIHLCLPMDRRGGDESTQNYNAFLRILMNMPIPSPNVLLYINVDAARLVQDLAQKNPDRKYGLINGANRKLFGNMWLSSFAKTAIDENLHRRSPLAAALAFLCNGGFNKRPRKRTELAERVEKYGGTVVHW